MIMQMQGTHGVCALGALVIHVNFDHAWAGRYPVTSVYGSVDFQVSIVLHKGSEFSHNYNIGYIIITS